MANYARIELTAQKRILGSVYAARFVRWFFSVCRKIRLPIEGHPHFSDCVWYASKFPRGAVHCRSDKDGLHIDVSKVISDPVYLISNGHPRSFKKLQFGEGLSLDGLGALDIGFFGQKDGSLFCSLVIVEFGANNNRLNTFGVSLNQAQQYVPSAEARRILVCLQIKGSGKLFIHGIRLESLPNINANIVSAEREGASEEKDGTPPAPVQSGSDLPLLQGLSDDTIYVRYSDAKSWIEQMKIAAQSDHAELYKWKRRALGWEKRAREAAAHDSGSQLSDIGQEAMLALAKSIPMSNGCRYASKIPLSVGIISDEYMFNFYKDVFEHVHYLSPDNYQQVFAQHKIHAVLYITGWKGISNEEWRGIKFREKPAKAFADILNIAKKRNTALVFQSIEDPSNFDYFLPIAEKFDYIFTSDTDSIERYKSACGHERVFYGEYGVNPILNNPIGCRQHIFNASFFAGSWTTRYAERCADMETIFDSILSSKGRLFIADRNYGTSSEDLQYPKRFRNGLMPAVDHKLLQSMHKLFRYNLNFNSIKNSPTMCAMRVYELQAMGVGVISNYAKSVLNKFPELRIVPWKENLRFDIGVDADLDEYRQNMNRLRNVLTDRTAHDIAERMLQAIGFGNVVNGAIPVVCVLYEGDADAVRKNFTNQSYASKILCDSRKFNTQSDWEAFFEENNVSYFTWFSGEDEYEKNYLQDLINGFKYTSCRYITKHAWFDGDKYIDGPQHTYTTTAGGKGRTVFAVKEFVPTDFSERRMHEPLPNLANGYCIDPFQLNYLRYCSTQAATKPLAPPALSVIVPVYNNGRFLREKCIASLKRNQTWKSMEILLVDDGSTDVETVRIIEELAREHGNIRPYFFETGGSGSASRPRNKGIELARAPMVSFLDPDNEISPGGYDTLLDIYKEAYNDRPEGVDFVSGYHVKVEDTSKPIGKHSAQRLLIVENLKQKFLFSGKFPVIPTQPAVIARRIFENPKFRFVEKSAGQDTLFGWELLCQARSGGFTDAAYLIYYAQRTGSVVNTVDKEYFEKKRILERAQSSMLQEYGLLDVYLKNHYERFMRDWYIPKLNMVADITERQRCIDILNDIASMYGRKFAEQ